MATNFYGRPVSKAIQKDVVSTTKKIYGFSYPLVANPKRGYFSKESGVTLVRNNLRQLLLTTKGERVMLPDFGTNLKYFLFEPLDKFTVQNIRDDILLAVSKYAPGVKVVSLRVYPSQSISMEGLQGLYINLTVQVEELNQQTLDVNVEIG